MKERPKLEDTKTSVFWHVTPRSLEQKTDVLEESVASSFKEGQPNDVTCYFLAVSNSHVGTTLITSTLAF
jgi:hypothetical protein